jgi:hypothetical protein
LQMRMTLVIAEHRLGALASLAHSLIGLREGRIVVDEAQGYRLAPDTLRTIFA